MTTDRPILGRKLLVLLVMGFSSGLPFSLIGSTLQAYLTKSGVSLEGIGLYSLIGAPYALKFLWAPLVDSVRGRQFGRRRVVLLAAQLALIAFILVLSRINPALYPLAFAGVGLLIAFASATQDIAVDAYRAEVLTEKELGGGVAIGVRGYRLGMICSGALALVLSDHLPWPLVYQIMAGAMLAGVVTTIFCDEPKVEAQSGKNALTLKEYLAPVRDLVRRSHALEIAAFILLYRAGDVLASTMTIPFLISIGFSNTEIGVMQKTFGPIALICGSLAGGVLMTKAPLRRSLFFFGVLQAVSTLMYLTLTLLGKNTVLFASTVAVEQFTAGMGTAAFLGFLIALCRPESTATHYAVLTSVVAVSRLGLEALSGYLAAGLGWTWFFLFAAVAAIPALIILRNGYGRWELRYNSSI